MSRSQILIRLVFCATLALSVSTSIPWPFISAAQDRGRAEPSANGFQQLQTRLATLNVNGIPLTSYHLAKAQAWLEFSKEEHVENDRSGIVDSTFAEAVKLIEQLESGVTTTLEMATPLLEGTARLDADSWQMAEKFKKEKLDCAGHLIARREVQLVHIEHEYHELGQIHAAPYRQAVQRMVEEIQAVDCSPPNTQKPVQQPESEPGPEPKP